MERERIARQTWPRYATMGRQFRAGATPNLVGAAAAAIEVEAHRAMSSRRVPASHRPAPTYPVSGGPSKGAWVEHPEHGVGRVLDVYPDRFFVRFGQSMLVLPPDAPVKLAALPAGAQTKPTPVLSPSSPRVDVSARAAGAPPTLPKSIGGTRRPASTSRKPAAQSRQRVLTGGDLVPAHHAKVLPSKMAAARPSTAGERGQRTRTEGGPASSARARDATWLVVPAELLRDIRADGFIVEQLTSHYAVRASRKQPDNLLRLRVTAQRGWEAQAAGNSGFGRTEAFKAEAPLVERRIQEGLRQTSRTGATTHVRAAMRKGRGRLVEAANKFAPPAIRRSRAPRFREVQGGAPGLGKRA